MELRDYQVRALADLRQAVGRGKRRIVLQCPTGGGKTVIAGAVTLGALAKHNRVAFVVPRLSLIDQTVARFFEQGIDAIGVIQARHGMTNIAQPVQVISVQSQALRDLTIYDTVIVDECHKQFKFIYDWMAKPEFRGVPFIGLSATPWARGMGQHWEHLIIAETTGGLIDRGHLAPFRCYAPSHPDLTGVRTIAGDYHEGELSMVMRQSDLIGDVVDTWRRLSEGRPTLVFAVDRAHAKALHGQFSEVGIPTGYIDYKTELEERDEVRRQFEAGDIKAVVSVETMTEGVDWPTIGCVVLARPTKSEMLFTQMVGRGLRTCEGKTDCLILDHADNTIRLGFVTDIHHDTLSIKKPYPQARRRNDPLPSPCPKCAFLRPPKVAVCPSCGFVAERQSDVVVGDGSLEEVVTSPKKSKLTIKAQLSRLPPVNIYSMLLGYMQRRGYKSGWAAAHYREITGRWPSDETKRISMPVEPSPMMTGWIKHKQIAYAYAKKRRKTDDGGSVRV